MPEALDLNGVKNIHLVGIGGCGVSALAKILHEMGYKVSGSDCREGPNTIRLKDLGIKVQIGHDPSMVRDTDLLVYSSAVSFTNPEIAEARLNNIKIIKRAEMLAWIINQSQTKIAVAGTHGKTTTTAMLARVLGAAGLNPTYLIGCDMDYPGSNGLMGDGRFAVTEADESDSSFLFLSPTIEVITNIEADHMEHFGDMEKLFNTFRQFLELLPDNGLAVIDATNEYNRRLMEEGGKRFLTYGLDPRMEFSATNIRYDKFSSRFMLLRQGQEFGEISLSVPGWQNILNSLAVAAIAFELDIPFASLVSGLHSFGGARRRFSLVGEYAGVMVIDDYAHHPTEVLATLAAARSGWPDRRLICAFQPHRYSRTMILKNDFATAFDVADKVIITDIYAASETPIQGISGKTIADLLPSAKTTYIEKKELIAATLVPELKAGDIVLTLGAGDIYTVGKELLSRLRIRENENNSQ